MAIGPLISSYLYLEDRTFNDVRLINQDPVFLLPYLTHLVTISASYCNIMRQARVSLVPSVRKII